MNYRNKIKTLEKRADNKLIPPRMPKSIMYDILKAEKEGYPPDGIPLNTGNNYLADREEPLSVS